jgi:MaoC like domain/short chain dehydrogenase
MSDKAGALAARRFTLEDQRWFAAVSGDSNPLHLDALAARRGLFGAPVVHGVHTALWALDALLGDGHVIVTRVTVSFPKPCFLDELVEVIPGPAGEDRARLKVQVGDVAVADIRVEYGDATPTEATDHRVATELPTSPATLALTDLPGRGGVLGIPADDGAMRVAFPALCASVGEPAVAQLAALSRLVGMECPGLHSLFSGFDVSLVDGPSDGLAWQVTRTDERYSAVTMEVSGGRWAGSVKAFVRPGPVPQAATADLLAVPEAHEFAAMRALVVGGSRGLGELTAKLVAAGGGESVVTWHRGEDDAERVVADIVAAGRTARAQQLDVDDPESAVRELGESGFVPTHLFYFASPRIFVRRTRFFDPELFAGFSRAYVTGFADTVAACRAAGVERLVAFYPSSVAVDDGLKDLTEYAAAKAAGEVVARTLGSSEKWLDVVITRLPRLPTDQTATLADAGADDPVAVMLAVLRGTGACWGASRPAEGATDV